MDKALAALRGGDVEGGLMQLERAVLSFGYKVCGHREDAEDTAQEVLLKVLPHAAKFENGKAFGVWLYTVARNACLMSRRRSKFAPREHLALEELMPDGEELAALATSRESSPESSVLRAENAEHVRAALDHLPTNHRLILILHDMEGLDHDEVASVTGLRAGTVRVRLHRARLALRKELARTELRFKTRSAETSAKKPRRCRAVFAALSDYLDETVDTELCDRIEKHLAGCAPCETFLADLERAVARCREFKGGECDRSGALREQLVEEYRKVFAAAQQAAAKS